MFTFSSESLLNKNGTSKCKSLLRPAYTSEMPRDNSKNDFLLEHHNDR